ncbi:MAG: peptide/nickel transport system permease protein [Mycobacterium sp.]|jgi:peptide/nickel transport system permease protein|nr:peptide/nickel transport system permease protein [Mycobacterium sp.]MDT5241010.1 peptide/nickel transport system permease protein [Mycobacterium sp.]MDT5285458.1 peptide/nickel transport system permease protein [Mycobacterium sp.]MDT5297126.1 peptide/nickel transport system permease protein [Mycobacterium sp.]MDT5359438.1 peptide/nickel transport system permease protein [Mycobacterium sp.]
MVGSIGELEAPGEPLMPTGVAAEEIRGRSPWYLAWLRLRRNRVGLAFGVLFLLIVVACLAAPLWADNVAHTGPNENHITDKILIDGQETYVVSPDGTPLGPGLHGRYLLGADQNGRDVMVRLLYGGRTSIYIGVVAALVTTVLAVLVGLLCGYYRGWIDAVLSRVMDVVWAFPVLLLGIALGTALALGGLKIGALVVAGDSLWIPILIIGLVYVPYMARPIRGEILALREKEFVEAAVAQGKGSLRIMFSELLPNVVSTIIVFFTLNIANNMLLESSLSFLGAGVRAPNASWGTMIADGYQTIYTAPHLTIVPGLLIVLTVLSLNVFGDGLRDALDPRAKIRLEH